ncbi:MAG: hypothetical protein KatS3mg032_1012 [Cyclobacteriaceae bacterium]|nr:MAG: hypothetical protein KatS3mg032_1012 [Cyclobacteriaceae bacterium]
MTLPPLWLSQLTGKIKNYIRYYGIGILKFFRKFQPERHQLTSTTSYNRYPELFHATRAAMQHTNPRTLKILSFGCSTGEECFSLAGYFPEASILGVDINRFNLFRARLRNTYPRIQFAYSAPEIIAKHAPYDLIFCLSVLCRWEDTKDVTNCASIYPFQKFEQTVTELAGWLKPGGLLVIYNSNFRFEDTAIAASFTTMPVSLPNSGFVHKFDRNNNRIYEVHQNCIYRKADS